MSVVFFDGVRPGCRCDQNPEPCEMPCWQRVGLTAEPCCPGCAPLPALDDEDVAA
jgi:hypothetical protein